MNKGTQLDPNLKFQSSVETMDDIPEAVRSGSKPLNSPHSKSNRQSANRQTSNLLLGSGIALLILTIGIGGVIYFPLLSSSESEPNSPQPKATATNSPTAIATNDNTSEVDENALLGHLAYEEAPRSALKNITADGRLKLREVAADKFLQMQDHARREGVILAPISAFRTIEEQDQLFFGIKEYRGQVVEERAEVSAPPGYSEHHTGYAVDIGDGKVPATHLTLNFADTKAFAWLEENASTYSFELSFPEDNPQGISYEPWHWRFVGDRKSLETFYKGKTTDSDLETVE